jgi:hypothetical protein
MQDAEKGNSISHLAVLTAIWSINVLIVIFGFPFLIYKKLKEIFLKTTRHPRSETNKR